MKVPGLALVASTSQGSASHPISSVEDATRVFGWLTTRMADGEPLIDADAWWSVEEAS